MSDLIKINNKDLQVKEFNSQRVVTFKDIDMLHERVEGTAKRNFNENKKHFIDGADYFLISKSEVGTDFVLSFGFDKFAASGVLLTESGYLMLVKGLRDDLAWKVQRELVNGYFRAKEQKQLTPMDQLKLQYQVLEEHDRKIEGVVKTVDDLQANMPLFNVECKELQALVRKAGIKALGGYKSPAYNDNSLRGKVYADIQHQLKREFGVNRYEAIKRCQLETAKRIIEEYKVPLILESEIEAAKRQIALDEVACAK